MSNKAKEKLQTLLELILEVGVYEDEGATISIYTKHLKSYGIDLNEIEYLLKKLVSEECLFDYNSYELQTFMPPVRNLNKGFEVTIKPPN